MATIVDGDTIQAVWFTVIDSTGSLKNTVPLLNDTSPLVFQKNSISILKIDKATATLGTLTVKGAVNDNTTI